jgi:hypothetical protein
MALFQLMEDAKADRFKEISKLVQVRRPAAAAANGREQGQHGLCMPLTCCALVHATRLQAALACCTLLYSMFALHGATYMLYVACQTLCRNPAWTHWACQV